MFLLIYGFLYNDTVLVQLCLRSTEFSRAETVTFTWEEKYSVQIQAFFIFGLIVLELSRLWASLQIIILAQSLSSKHDMKSVFL